VTRTERGATDEDLDPQVRADDRTGLVKELEGIYPRLRLKAMSLERKVMGRRRLGAPMIGVDADDLIQRALMRLLSASPPFNPAHQTLLHYLFRRMEDDLKQILERVENDTHRTSYASEDEYHNLVAPLDFQSGQTSIDSYEYMRRFMEWIHLKDPRLHRLANLMVEQDVLSAPDQAVALGETVKGIYKLRERLRTATDQFESLNMREVEKAHS
jgi:DNA-directed RNA polymerase specialized sigma24 family protein